MIRRAARFAAMQLIYEHILGGEGGDETRYGLMELDRQDEEIPYINAVADGVMRCETELDAALGPFLVDWTIERMAKVDLSILRLACYEILYREDIPVSVSINEAVEMAREFSIPDACVFVNGVLGSMVRARKNDIKKDMLQEQQEGE